MKSDKITWLTNINEISTATIDSLKLSLLTLDGRGAEFKEKCLDELLKRERSKERENYNE